jgi:hypothetical protein
VGLFTVNFELGDKTLETLRQIANTVLCLGISRQKGPGRCGDPLMERKTDGISVELRGVTVRPSSCAAGSRAWSSSWRGSPSSSAPPC